MDLSLRVDPEHFDYLRIQKGSLDDISHDRPRWHRAYEADIRETYRQIEPWLPDQCERLLDVGSGLGGIDVLVARHYAERGQAPAIRLLDGEDDPPVMHLHRHTFNNMRIARNFFWKNGVNPTQFGSYAPEVEHFEAPFDFITSFGSWCFHMPPSVYLPAICSSGLKPSTVLVIDVRKHRLEWMADLERVLELVTVVATKPKWSRCVFRVRQ